MPESRPRLLLVDDEATICRMLKIQLQGSYEIEVASSGAEGLKLVQDAVNPFHIVVSDFEMPGMDGPAFLAHVREESPHTVRILLTGHREFSVAMEAINAGAVFRVVSKPCSARELGPVLEDAYEQFQMQDAERELLTGTLDGAVNLLLDVMSMISPKAVSKSEIAAKRVKMLCDEIDVTNAWEVRLAAMLSSVGEIVADAGSESASSAAEHAQIAAKLVARIPRLSGVAEIIANQNVDFQSANDLRKESWFKGACILRVAVDLANGVSRGQAEEEAIRALYKQQDDYDPQVLATLISQCSMDQLSDVKSITVAELEVGMMLAGDIVDNHGELLVTKGRDVTQFLRERIINFSNAPRGVKQPLEIFGIAAEADPVAV